MNVANKELCKELATLSGWHETDQYHESDNEWSFVHAGGQGRFYQPPAYDLGYLLRKLPGFVTLQVAAMANDHTCNWESIYERWSDHKEVARTLEMSPEDSICKLAIELFKQGILKRDD